MKRIIVKREYKKKFKTHTQNTIYTLALTYIEKGRRSSLMIIEDIHTPGHYHNPIIKSTRQTRPPKANA